MWMIKSHLFLLHSLGSLGKLLLRRRKCLFVIAMEALVSRQAIIIQEIMIQLFIS